MLISLVLASIVASLVPPVYTSTGIAVLVQPRQAGVKTAADANPLLNFDSSLSTTALIMVQSLDTPEVATQLGLTPHALIPSGDTFTVKDVGNTNVGDQIVQPFIYITGQSSTAAGSADIVRRVQEFARQDLIERQRGLRVTQQNYIKLESVVDPTEPKPMIAITAGAAIGTFIIGAALTILVALMWEKIVSGARARRRDRVAQSGAEEDGVPQREDVPQRMVPLPAGFTSSVATANGTVLSSNCFELPTASARGKKAGSSDSAVH
ncbi:MAG TPA: hypothetical protein VK735_29600 [Pseudonocardia sp.]|uniref:hypothetical protein n=1 Tax=Pseudonocardia sp. TaxID=60912 RepID=UPI002CF6E2F7|nr:hypothetical protein [Pseudonocardia sp.]HTF51622.1 hypothetical protein [Pseudonocardia sp.]